MALKDTISLGMSLPHRSPDPIDMRAVRQVAQRAVESVGGKLEALYFTFGDHDFVGVVDVPDNVSAAALSLAVSSAGGSNFKTIVLLTPEEMDQAVRKEISFTPPGR